MSKETFIIRTEWQDAILQLDPIDQATIFQNLFHYHCGNGNLINLNNLPVKLVWSLILPSIVRNIESYDRRMETSAINGKNGGRPKKDVKKEDNNLDNNLNNLPKPIETLSDSDSVFDSVSDSDSEIGSVSDFKKNIPQISEKPIFENIIGTNETYLRMLLENEEFLLKRCQFSGKSRKDVEELAGTFLKKYDGAKKWENYGAFIAHFTNWFNIAITKPQQTKETYDERSKRERRESGRTLKTNFVF